ncbi:hypothetical protein E1B28_005164 [Marasmius oreades]|uniref:Uncharacterized protein n=1 Tax=Marasmius oreades TaxID=181124 RepID=A0A9P7V060_9AGAR|nr:uncharacterized protein E1B28_005164 [Marasmius oreades]KAG7097849.1 hypothetical protein E1B28_005164 [Marasmius oreades]
MSLSPPSRRARSASKEQEDLINAYEAEEERIINVLSRKLEQLRQDKIELENTLEAESESHVNRLTRELSFLKAQQQAGQTNGSLGNNEGAEALSCSNYARSPADPTTEVMLEALRRENETLRNRLAEYERDYMRLSRLNEIYREELIEHRSRLGRPVDNLIGISSNDPFSQPLHHRSPSSSSRTSSPSTSFRSLAPYAPRAMSVPVPIPGGVPIPRPPSQIHRPINSISSQGNTPLSHSPTSVASESPYTFSPPGALSTDPASLVSNGTNVTTPPSSASIHNHYHGSGYRSAVSLSYPSVPPPSLSSSFGSPNISYYMGREWDRDRDRDRDNGTGVGARDLSLSPIEPLSLSRRSSIATGRRGSITTDWRVAETGSLRGGISRRGSVERGGRVAETGTLVRSRAGSQNSQSLLPSTSEVTGTGTGTGDGRG